MSEVKRFWSKVVKSTPDECWEWLDFKDKFGYGHFRTSKRTIRSHRFSLELKEGRELSPEECACHKCNNTSCVNPYHLYVGTQADNMRDLSVSRRVRGERHSKCKVNDSKVSEMIKLRNEGVPVKDIASMYNISESHCSRLTRSIGRRFE